MELTEYVSIKADSTTVIKRTEQTNIIHTGPTTVIKLAQYTPNT